MPYEVTPVGTLTGFIAIEKPSTKFDDDGVYSCQVLFSGNDAKLMKEKIDGFMNESLRSSKGKKLASPPYEIIDKTLSVKFKQKAVIHNKRTGEDINLYINLYDSKNKLIDTPVGLGEGSKIKVAYKTYPWNAPSMGAGVTLQPAMIQIIEFVKSDFSSGNSPFSEEDGFTSGPKDSPFEEDEAMSDETSDNGDF